MVDGKRLIPLYEVNRLNEDIGFKPPEKTKVSIDNNDAKVSSDVSSELSNPDSLLTERGLSPDEWEVTNIKVNEWDGPTGEPCKQLTVHAKRKFDQLSLFQPAFEPDSYVAPKKVRMEGTGPRLVVFAGDQQAPYFDPDLHGLFCSWLEANTPDYGILMGDTVDFPDISRHNPNPEWDRTAQDCINSGYVLLRDYVQSSSNTSWTKLMGNHDERIRNRLVNLYTNLYGLRRADVPGEDPEAPALCVSNLLRLDALGIKLIRPNGGYQHAQVQVSKHLAARHGWIASKGSGTSALSTLRHLGYSIVVGHTHRQSLVHKTTHDIDGAPSTLAAAETGCLCMLRDGLGYTVAPDWQNGFATASIWPDGTFKIDLATYANGRLYWRDQCYGDAS